MKDRVRDIGILLVTTVLIAAGLVWIARDIIGVGTVGVAITSIVGTIFGFGCALNELRGRRRTRNSASSRTVE